MKNYIMIFLTMALSVSAYSQNSNDSTRIVTEAIQMISFPNPTFEKPFAEMPTPKQIEDLGFAQPNQYEDVAFTTKDDEIIYGRKYPGSSNKTILLLHGTLSSSYTYNIMGGLLRDVLQASVLAIDLRGHGKSGGIPGDVSTLNQYAEDLNDIVKTIKTEKPDETIILAGHSMGGGIVLRYIETFPQNDIAGYLLFAPNLGNNSPTTSKDMNLKSNFVKMHLARGLGLRMLNEFGIHKYDSLPIVFYNLPAQMPIKSYSYRSMEASVPKDYRVAIRKIDKPFLVFVGSKDEVFIAEEYPIIFDAYSKGSGKCHIIENETHNGIRHNPEVMEITRLWGENQLN